MRMPRLGVKLPATGTPEDVEGKDDLPNGVAVGEGEAFGFAVGLGEGEALALEVVEPDGVAVNEGILLWPAAKTVKLLLIVFVCPFSSCQDSVTVCSPGDRFLGGDHNQSPFLSTVTLAE